MFKELEINLPANRVKQKVALIDGDIIKYRIGFAAETMLYKLYVPYEFVPGHNPSVPFTFEGKKAMNEWIAKAVQDHKLDEDVIYFESSVVPDKVENALHSAKLTIERIIKGSGCHRAIIYISGKGNYRDDIATTRVYKGNRKDARKPYHYQSLHDYMVQYYDTHVVDGIEADDAMGIHQYGDLSRLLPDNEVRKRKSKTVICTLDKDLDVIPGWHYNWVKEGKTGVQGMLYWVSEEEAMYNFYRQAITGDSTDNIEGIYRVGPVAARNLLREAKSEQEAYDIALGAYEKWISGWKDKPENVKEVARDRLHETATLVWILRTHEEKGKCPFEMGYYDVTVFSGD